MSDTVRYERRGNIAVITVDNPPVNALSASVREGLADSLANGRAADPRSRPCVLIGAGRTYIAGADIREFGKPMTGPGLQQHHQRFRRFARSRSWSRSTAPRWAAGSKSRSAATIASRCRRRSSAFPR